MDKYIYNNKYLFTLENMKTFLSSPGLITIFLLFCGLDFLLALRHVPYWVMVNPALLLACIEYFLNA